MSITAGWLERGPLVLGPSSKGGLEDAVPRKADKSDGKAPKLKKVNRFRAGDQLQPQPSARQEPRSPLLAKKLEEFRARSVSTQEAPKEFLTDNEPVWARAVSDPQGNENQNPVKPRKGRRQAVCYRDERFVLPSDSGSPRADAVIRAQSGPVPTGVLSTGAGEWSAGSGEESTKFTGSRLTSPSPGSPEPSSPGLSPHRRRSMEQWGAPSPGVAEAHARGSRKEDSALPQRVHSDPRLRSRADGLIVPGQVQEPSPRSPAEVPSRRRIRNDSDQSDQVAGANGIKDTEVTLRPPPQRSREDKSPLPAAEGMPNRNKGRTDSSRSDKGSPAQRDVDGQAGSTVTGREKDRNLRSLPPARMLAAVPNGPEIPASHRDENAAQQGSASDSAVTSNRAEEAAGSRPSSPSLPVVVVSRPSSVSEQRRRSAERQQPVGGTGVVGGPPPGIGLGTVIPDGGALSSSLSVPSLKPAERPSSQTGSRRMPKNAQLTAMNVAPRPKKSTDTGFKDILDQPLVLGTAPRSSKSMGRPKSGDASGATAAVASTGASGTTQRRRRSPGESMLRNSQDLSPEGAALSNSLLLAMKTSLGNVTTASSLGQLAEKDVLKPRALRAGGDS